MSDNKLLKLVNEILVEHFLYRKSEYKHWNKNLIPYFIEEEKRNLLYEGLITSQIKHVVVGKLKKNNYDVLNTKENDNIKIKTEIGEVVDENLNKLFHLMNVLGWFLSSFEYENKRYNAKDYDVDKIKYLANNKAVILLFEPKFDVEVSVPHKLYHASPTYNRDKIQSLGLGPRSQSKKSKHPERIYFTYDIISAKGLVNQLSSSVNPKTISKIKEQFGSFSYDIYEIDARKINDLILFSDPNSKDWGCYTLDNIPSNYIKIIQTVDVENKQKPFGLRGRGFGSFE